MKLLFLQTEKPKKRSALRLLLGKWYFTSRRHLYWFFGGFKFAQKSSEILEYSCFSHKTPLLRKLKDVDMYLQYNKVINLKIAVPKISSIILYPGETFSYWKLIGKPSKRKGYTNGMVLRNGSFYPGIGGGLCQLSNLIYWMTIHTPLTVVERHRHGYDVFPDSNRTQPFGSGATCAYNYLDLIIKNNTSQAFQLLLEVTESDLEGRWKSDSPLDCKYEVYEKEHIIQSEYWGGYSRHNCIYRKKYTLENILLDDEFVVENHALMMYSPFLPESTL